MIRYFRKKPPRTKMIPELISVEDDDAIPRSEIVVTYPKVNPSKLRSEFYFYTSKTVVRPDGELYLLRRDYLDMLYDEISQAEFTSEFL